MIFPQTRQLHWAPEASPAEVDVAPTAAEVEPSEEKLLALLRPLPCFPWAALNDKVLVFGLGSITMTNVERVIKNRTKQ